MSHYEYIPDYKDDIETKQFADPLKTPDRYDPIWNDIDLLVEEYARKENEKSAQTKDPLYVKYEEKANNLIPGTINLINFILEQHSTKPIDTIVFLDRSARLAAYIFRTLWNMLQDKGLIDSNVQIPEYKFINIGHDNYNYKNISSRALGLIEDIFPKEDLEQKNVLVVDEIIESGRSAKNALQFLAQAYGIKGEALAQFKGIPGWYWSDSKKGTEDPNIPGEIYSLLENIDSNVFETLKAMVNEKVSEPFLIQFTEDARVLDTKQFVLKYSKLHFLGFSNNLLRLISTELQKNYSQVFAKPIITYFKTSGGFLSIRPHRKYLRFSNRYRNYLKEMVQQSLPYITT